MPTNLTRSDRLGLPLAGPIGVDAETPLMIFAAKPGAGTASGPPSEITLAEPASVEFQAVEAAEGEEPKLPTFSMVAHTFKPVRVGGWYYPVVVDAQGLKIPSQTRPIRYGHDSNQGVGHTTSIAIENGKLVASGVISRATPAASDVVNSSKNGFPWQASIGASVDDYQNVKEGESVEVNGVTYKGPLVVARRTTLNEISFVDLGADDKTKARVAAGAKGAGDDDEGRSSDREPIDAADAVSQSQARAKAEKERQAGIQALHEEYLGYRGVNIDVVGEIIEEALNEGWSVQDTRIQLLENARPRASQPRRSKDKIPTESALAAGLCMACGISDETLAKDRDFGPDVVQEAWAYRNRGLRGTIAAALEASGRRVPHGNTELFNEMLNACRAAQFTDYAPRGIQAQVFSTVNLPGLLGNVANKVLLDAFTQVNAIYPMIADQADFSNFHTHSIYRLGVNGDIEPIGPGGELKHVDLAEDTYTNKLGTRGAVLALTREMIINDDINAFRSLTAQLARKTRIAVEKALVNAIMESVDAFYTTARGNKITSNGLGIGALGASEAALLGMTDSSGDPTYAMARYLLVPPGLKYLADQIFTSSTLNESTTANAGRPTDNPFRGRFTPVSSPFLALSSLDGYSATTWYMLADPAVLPAFQVAYLDGRRAPTIETADTAFDTLGMQMRVYFDFGVAQIDYRGAIKNVA